MTRRVRYAMAGGLLALGAPAGLLLVRLRRPTRMSIRALRDELQAELGIYIYSGAATATAFALFGAVVGDQADRLAQLATTDPLTGLANPRSFNERLRHEIVRADRYKEPVSVLLIDLDGLKRVNDVYGHPAGDAALLSIAEAIRSGLRETDLGARLGGDEFAVLAPGTDEAAALVLAERLRAYVTRGLDGRGRRRTTISIGAASYSAVERASVDALMSAADEALYRAKRMGGNRVSAAS